MNGLDRQRTLGRWHGRRDPAATEIMLYIGSVPEVQQAISDIDAVDDIDLVIVDTPPSLDEHPAEVALLLRWSDFVLVPTTQGTADLTEANMRVIVGPQRRVSVRINRGDLISMGSLLAADA